ncbi:hypothetical protein L249_1562, partial [Ophiocordyceps polyrhachis-furcata BCC 54312]
AARKKKKEPPPAAEAVLIGKREAPNPSNATGVKDVKIKSERKGKKKQHGSNMGPTGQSAVDLLGPRESVDVDE